MKFLILLITSILTFWGNCYGQTNGIDSVKKFDTPVVERDFVETVFTNPANGKDSVVISIQQFEELKTLLEGHDSALGDILPSLVALLVVVISTWGAMKIGKKQIESQIKNGKDTLRSQEAQSQEQLKVARTQIQETSRLAIKQINSTNRQAWIIETRNAVAELTTHSNMLNIEFQEKKVDFEKRKILHEKVTLSKNKLNLLLKKDKHKDLLEAVAELMTALDIHLFNSKANNDPKSAVGFIPFDNANYMAKTIAVIDVARDVLYGEWGGIQSDEQKEP